MADTSTAGNSRQRLRQLIDDLLLRARRASCETESLARLVVETYLLDVRKARSAAAYLEELGYVGDALRLREDVGHLRRKACEVFQRSISPRTEPHDLEQAQRDLESLNSEASRLVVFLRELESFCVNENASATPTAKPGEGQAAGGTAAEKAVGPVQDRVPPEPEKVPLAESKQVKLFGPADQPLIDGKARSPLTKAQYDVVLALIRAGEDGLTKDELDRNSKHGDARKIMRRLAENDSAWKKVLLFSGKTGGRYRIK